ncbi:alpha/beta hydrolase fold domain-containing protein [Anatilimnocola sp. NA78]|uniref:alpha/beta hydrolase fold domain-containing protein n=1 Tax=Anatilimnocola sp. NA78 TaxID=3415683 RepID=UPI003CE4CB54
MRTFHLFTAMLALLCCSVIAPSVFAQKAAQRPMLPKGYVAEYDVKYVPDGDEAQALDIYFHETAADKPLPLLIWIHGGGWSGGSKAGMPYLGQLPRGYVAASIEYRFSQKAPFPAQIQDCQAAIRFLRANAKKYNIDPERIGVGGASAGGHLAALVGTSGGKKAFPMIGGNEDQSDRVQAVCDVFGPTNFWTVIAQAEDDELVKNIFKWNAGDPYSRLIAAKLGEDKEKCDAVSPVNYVSKDNPPFLILHGDHDTLVPYAQSVELKDLLTKSGVEVTLQRLPGAGHGGAAFALPAIAKLTSTFYDKHLKGVDAKIEALPESEVTVKAAAPTK